MWHGVGAKPDSIRALKQVKKGDRVLCYHSAPERSLYSIAEVTRDPYPDPHDYDGKNLVADLRAYEKLPRPVTLPEMRANPALRKVKLLKSVRRIISPLTEVEYQELLRMAGIVAMPVCPCLDHPGNRSINVFSEDPPNIFREPYVLHLQWIPGSFQLT